jgi:hypothetical protein
MGLSGNDADVSGDEAGVEMDAVQALNTTRAKRPMAIQYCERIINLLTVYRFSLP